MKRVFYFFADLFFYFLSILPKSVLYFISDILFLIIYYLTGYRKRVVYENLINSFPDKSEKEIKQITKKYYRHLCDLVLEDGALIKMSKKKVQSFVRYENPEFLEEYYKLNQNIIMVFGHYGNWEFLSSLPLHTKYNFLPVYKKIQKAYLNSRFLSMRSLFGSKPVRMKETLKVTLDYYKRKDPFILALIADQRPRKKDVNYWIEFFNQDTPVFIGPEKIGKRIEAAIIFVNIEKEKRGLYNIKFSEISNNAKNTEEFEITELFFNKMDKQISAKPEYWVWSHKRWKYEKTKFMNKN
jgi:KDO2-lipid IV(A) lauroyltransferase